MSNLANTHALPSELSALIDEGELTVSKQEDGKIEFDIPALGFARGSKYQFYTLIWIDPARNAELCDYYNEVPGDLPNLYVRIDTDQGELDPPEIESVDDFLAWLDGEDL